MRALLLILTLAAGSAQPAAAQPATTQVAAARVAALQAVARPRPGHRVAPTPAAVAAPAIPARDEFPFRLCEAAIAAAETGSRVPPNLLTMIARVESGRLDAAGRGRAWPWTTNINGVGAFYETKEDAIAAVLAHQARGDRSIDVGCMQVNLFFHPDAFADLDEAFDPGTNARYAEHFLSDLQGQFKTWPLATAAYHSQVQERGEDYQRKVYGLPPIDRTPTINLAGPFPTWPPKDPKFAAFLPQEAQFGAFAFSRR